MKKGGRVMAEAGFTIVETLIVLAVSSALLTMAILFVNGRQSKTEFQVGINNLRQQIQQIVNQTQNGYYNNTKDFSCNGSGTVVSLASAAGQEQGTNAGCIFMGTAIQFGTGTGDATNNLGIIPLVGKQFSTGQNSIQTVVAAKPRAVYALGAEPAPTGVAYSESMQHGLAVSATGVATGCSTGQQSCFINGSGVAVKTGMIAIVAGDNTGQITSTLDADLKPGTQLFSLYGVSTSVPNVDIPTAAATIGNYAAVPSRLVLARKAYICIESGTTKQSGLISITNDLQVDLKIYGTTTCS